MLDNYRRLNTVAVKIATKRSKIIRTGRKNVLSFFHAFTRKYKFSVLFRELFLSLTLVTYFSRV